MDHTLFSTKARTLLNLKGKLKSALIPDSIVISVSQWKKNKIGCLEKINKKLFAHNLYIVRSSCQREDNFNTSNAGAYLSIGNIESNDLSNAITRVISSYSPPKDDDEVLIQPMLKNIVASGVAFSHDQSSGAPYRIISLSEGLDSSIVTSGYGGKTYYFAACANKNVFKHQKYLLQILNLLEELLDIFHVPLDLEFAITKENNTEKLWLLQVRPLVLRRKPQPIEEQKKILTTIEHKIKQGMNPHPFLKGRRTVYGVMPDWNPAEIIGIKPHPLALSLYRELVTDMIWAYQRNNYGYRNLRSFPLMVHFFGLPYIDVRVSFNSFIPIDLDESLAERLVEYYIDRLIDAPYLHDKVEFDIVFSCYTLDIREKLEILKDFGFSSKDIEDLISSLNKLTNRIIHPENGLWTIDVSKIDILKSRREELLRSNTGIVEKIFWLLEDTKRYGTLPFAGLARAGFIAVQMLRSLVNVGIFSDDDYSNFMQNICTVVSQMERDRQTLDKTNFIKQYGHLRPGTYDILSLRYDESPENYFDWSHSHKDFKDKPFVLSIEKMKSIRKILKEHNLFFDVIDFFDFLKTSIEMREWSKFYFTKNLSDILSFIQLFGEEYGFSREDMAFCDISIFKELYIGAVDIKQIISSSIERNKKIYEDITCKITLPPLIIDPQDVWAFAWPEAMPNFITSKRVVGETLYIKDLQSNEQLKDKIVLIFNADPGYDWLFSHPIAGLITAYGGINSHMAIRAAELELPSAIGVGEVMFNRFISAKRICIDCKEKRVFPC